MKLCERCNAKLSKRDQSVSETPGGRPYAISPADSNGAITFDLCSKCQTELDNWLEYDPGIVQLRAEYHDTDEILEECDAFLESARPGWCTDWISSKLEEVYQSERVRLGRKQPRLQSLIKIAKDGVAQLKREVARERKKKTKTAGSALNGRRLLSMKQVERARKILEELL